MFDVRRTFMRGAYLFALVVLTVFASPYEVGSKLSDATTSRLRPALVEEVKSPHRLPVLRDSVSKDPLSDGMLSFTCAANEPNIRG